ncbi:RNA polymerase sigma-70 factor [Maribellus sp. CM-23]|uniref:RNA polymerase sigma-70 factor n=1 Tax=Maribellus sp. CM-23 TaxID=2781026 RepID=UPI001F206422|nr:RNA polymerase sigma-70 factor [Maribellus sp. CM-23]MCE4565747.1 RNA polymerase sigma-70 factor [Maribellus sp. CM-23]
METKERLMLTKEQYGTFFKKNYHTACLVALRYIPDIDRAEDMVQDVFVALWEKRKELQIERNLKSYLLSTVKNHAINRIQRDKTNTVSLSKLEIDLEESESEEFEKEELSVKLAEAIKTLPPACHNIFSLAYKENFTYQQIADELNLSKNTVKTQMGIAYRQLRDKLRQSLIVLMQIFQK